MKSFLLKTFNCKKFILMRVIQKVAVLPFLLLSASHSTAQVKSDFYSRQVQSSNSLREDVADPMQTFTPCQMSLLVKNLDETVYWYQHKLGFKIIKTWKAGHVAYNAVCLELNGFQIEVYEHPTEDFTNRIQPVTEKEMPISIANIQVVRHIAFKVQNLDAVVVELKYRQVEFLWDPIVDYYEGIKVCYIIDNNGNPIKLLQDLD